MEIKAFIAYGVLNLCGLILVGYGWSYATIPKYFPTEKEKRGKRMGKIMVIVGIICLFSAIFGTPLPFLHLYRHAPWY